MKIKDRIINVIVETIQFFTISGLSLAGISYLVIIFKLGGTSRKIIMGTLALLVVISIIVEEITRYKKCKATEELIKRNKEEKETRAKILDQELEAKRKYINKLLDTELSKLSKSEIEYIKNMNK